MSRSAVLSGDDVLPSFKVVLLGEGAVGKTSLILRFAENQFTERHISTLQASFHTKSFYVDGRHIGVSIWDTAGQERFHALGPIYYRDSHGAILVYDVTDEDSFKKERFHALGSIYIRDTYGTIGKASCREKVKRWVIELRKMLGHDVCLRIVGNKVDCEKDRHVTLREAETYSASVGAKHFLTSAKFNKGIEDLFLDLSREMVAKADEKQSQAVRKSTSPQQTSSRKTITIVNDETTSRVCCGGFDKF